jgi:protein-S-isoprenylcysteine O-methyltransferase Ste14
VTVATHPLENPPSVVSGAVGRFAQIGFGFVLEAVILFVGVGRLDWTWAWILLGIYVATVVTNAMFLRRTGLGVIAERGRALTHMRDWDKLVSGGWSASQYLALPLIAAVDIRFGWTAEFSAIGQLAGAIVLASGLALFSSAMIVNAYFSTAARIQNGQTVCRSGPYRFVRHPGYAGAILQSFGIAFLLGSWWAVIPAAAAAVFIVLRTVMEDRMLRSELAGYDDYVRQVPFRLLPWCW